MILENMILEKTPKIVLSVKDNSWLGKTRLFDLVEFRADLFASLEYDSLLCLAASFTATPTIFTVRSKQEGGGFLGSESKRLSLFKKMMPHNISAVDIELSAKTILPDLIDNAHEQEKTVIVSFHNFDKTPSNMELEKILRRAKAAGADIVKIATFAKDHQDIQRLAQFTVANASQNIVTIAMGEIGSLSRLFFPALGSLLTYTTYGDKTAPGQIDCRELSRLIKRFYPKSPLHRIRVPSG